MSDNPAKRGKPDRIRISSQWHERRYWCKRLGITESQLRVAIAATGPMVKNVKRWLINRIKNA